MAGCNLPGVETSSSELDVTQALQTKDAGLTEAVAKTLSLSPNLANQTQNRQKKILP